MKKLDGKVIGVWADAVSLNVGKSRLLSVPIHNFKAVPEKGDIVEFSCDKLICKQYKGKDDTPVLAKTLTARSFKALAIRSDYEEVDVDEIEDDVDADDAVPFD